MTTAVLSVGYERRTVEELLELLAAHHIEKVLDVRELPLSRKRGFSKQSLAAHLDAAGIDYLHLRSAGNPFRNLKADVERCLELYESHLCENPEVIDLLATEMEGTKVAVLCYERLHDSCHRSILLSALSRNGYDIDVIETH